MNFAVLKQHWLYSLCCMYVLYCSYSGYVTLPTMGCCTHSQGYKYNILTYIIVDACLHFHTYNIDLYI